MPTPSRYADTVSSQITGLFFEDLLDLDADLRLRGRIATNWEVTEEYVLQNSIEPPIPL